MSLTISHTATPTMPINVMHPKPATPRPAAGVAPRQAAAPAAASSNQENAALNQLMAKNKADLSRGMAAGTLSGLGRQIMAAAKAAGQHVSLPSAPGGSAEAAAAPITAPAPAVGKVNITA